MILEALTRIIRLPFDPSKPDILPGQKFRASDFAGDDPIQESIKRAIAAGQVLIDGRLPVDIGPDAPLTIDLASYGVTESSVTRMTVGA
jgi:hypothetical protein